MNEIGLEIEADPALKASEYRRKLMHDIERKIILLGTSMPPKEEHHYGTYRVVVWEH